MKKSFGYAFKDQVDKVAVKAGHFQKNVGDDWKDSFLPNFQPDSRSDLQKSFWRGTLFLGFALIFFFILFLRLFYLQIVQGSHNRELADGNRILVKTIHAARGIIFDRNGEILASNAPGFRLTDPKSKKTFYVTREEAFEMEIKNDPRIKNLEVDSIRKYSQAEELAHVIGYIGEISEAELKNPQYKNYRGGDRIGKSGLEDQYENILRGKDGGEVIEVDAQGKKLRTIRTVAPKPGQNLYITIDSDLQHQTYKQLEAGIVKAKSCCGAAIAMDPMNGQILALVSYPSFNPNIFTEIQSSDLISEILLREDAPVLNRVIGGLYPPASTYKIISSLAALESGKITPATQFEDKGRVLLGPYSFANWYFTQHGKTEGFVDVVKALKRSNDTYYYYVGQTIGEQALIDWSKKANLGNKLGIDLGGEVAGLVPDNDWKIKNTGQEWYPGDTLHMAIGQGFLLTTPLQVLGYTALIAADGRLFKPQLFFKSTTANDAITADFKPETLISSISKPEFINVVKKGLEQVTIDGGTAWPFFTFPVKTAGKTGTAEFGDPKDRTHAWYTAYAPANDPKITLTILVEAGGEGSSVASPIGKEIFRWFLSANKTELIKDTNFVASESAKILGE